MNSKTLLLILSSFFFLSTAHSFINIESLRQSDELGLLGSLGLKVNGASGNTDKFNSSLGANNIYRNKNNEYLSLLNYSYSEVSNTKNIHRGQIHLRYTTHFPKTFSIETFTQIQFDDFKSLKYRKLLGVGLRKNLLSSPSQWFSVGLGAFYESEEFEDLTKNILFRYNVYASYKAKLNDTSALTFVNYLQPSVDDIKNIRVKSHFNLKLKLYKNLSLSNDIRYSFDSNLKKPIEKGDLTYMTGFNLKY
ncbi:MAG: DUF481 domain-containing protein [Bdellovibrionales bacterium]